MKTIIITLFSCLFCISLANAQLAIYICNQTGMWAASYYNGSPPYLSMEETRQEAYDHCVKVGGRDCMFFWATECRDCWVSFIISNDGSTLNYAAQWSSVGESHAEYLVREVYKKNNGVNYYGAKVTNMYMPK